MLRNPSCCLARHRPRTDRSSGQEGGGPRPFRKLVIACVLVAPVCSATLAVASLERCTGALHTDVCAEQTHTCPTPAGSVGLAVTDWPVFQHDVQHTGKSAQSGPSCAAPQPIWTTKLTGRIESASIIGPAGPSGQGTIYVPISHNPVCALDATDGHALWCKTNDFPRDVGFAGPVLSADDTLYVGTRDNDLWHIALPEPPQEPATVLWKQKVCTDGDVVTPAVISSEGLVYMGSDSLSSGSLFAMCPGDERQVKWCHNPIGGAVTNVSPALSPDQSRLYITYQGGSLVSYDASTGEEKWRVRLEARLNNGRWNYTPVVNPVTGRVYVGFDSGLFAVDTHVDPDTLVESPVVSLLYDTYTADRARILSPPALDLAHDAIYFAAMSGPTSSLYAITTSGALKWKRTKLPGAVKNNPPVVDADGRVYFALKRLLHAIDPATGNDLWTFSTKSLFIASPVITSGRVYVGSKAGMEYALGCAG